MEALSQDKIVKRMSIVEPEVEIEGGHLFSQTWTDVEYYVIMSTPTRSTQFDTTQLITEKRVKNRGKFSEESAQNYLKLMKKLRRRSAKKRYNKKIVESGFGLSGVLKSFPFSVLFWVKIIEKCSERNLKKWLFEKMTFKLKTSHKTSNKNKSR